MLEAIAFIAIVTAAITSSFVERARRQQAATETGADRELGTLLAEQLADITARLDGLQRTLDELPERRRE
jgi:hypothetical protein